MEVLDDPKPPELPNPPMLLLFEASKPPDAAGADPKPPPIELDACPNGFDELFDPVFTEEVPNGVLPLADPPKPPPPGAGF